MKHRICPRCKEEKSATGFYSNPSHKDGLSTYCKACESILGKEKYKLHRDIIQQRSKISGRQRRHRIRCEVLAHYSCGKPLCAYCGEEDNRCLSIDHINGGGNAHRRYLQETRGVNGWNMYDWLKKNDYPKGYQVLCMNCQFRKLRTN